MSEVPAEEVAAPVEPEAPVEEPAPAEAVPDLSGVHTVDGMFPEPSADAPAEIVEESAMNLVVLHTSGAVSKVPVDYGKLIQVYDPNKGVVATVALQGVHALELVFS